MSLRVLSRVVRSSSRTLRNPALRYSRPCLNQNLQSSILSRGPVTKAFAAAFSSCSKNLSIGDDLTAKLHAELQLEQSTRSSDNYSGIIAEYLENSLFELKDTPGQEEVTLSRKYNDEDIRVTFTIADLGNLESDQEPNDEDQALYDDDIDSNVDEMLNAQSGGAHTKGVVNSGRDKSGNVKVSPEEDISPANRPELEDEEFDNTGRETSFPAHVSIKIEKADKGVLCVEAEARDGDFVILSVQYFPDTDMAEPRTAEKEWERRGLYTGPLFGSLDEELQILFEKYLQERGINTRMALFIPEYIDAKEQKEYVRWLSNLKSFVE